MNSYEEKFREMCLAGAYPGGASSDAIAEAERALGVSFPDAYREFLAEFGALVAQGFELYGLLPSDHQEPPMWQSVVEVTRTLRRLKQAGTERPSLIPVSDDGTGVYFFMDFNPGISAPINAIGRGVDLRVANSFHEFALLSQTCELNY